MTDQLKNGERQVSETREEIRRDHVARYEFAADYLLGNQSLEEGALVLDVACGVGYGTQLLAEVGFNVVGVDRSREAITYADAYYPHRRAHYVCEDVAAGAEFPQAAAAVCFETIEHLKDPAPLLRALAKAAPRLIASAPNEAVFPHGGTVMHHYRHYTGFEFETLLQDTGWHVAAWREQQGPESEVDPCEVVNTGAIALRGRTLIAVCERKADPKPLGIDHPNAFDTRAEAPGAAAHRRGGRAVPRHVAILGLGPSVNQYLEITKRLGGRRAYCDEVWGINALGDVLACDLVWHMDDIRIQEARAKRRPESNIARMVEWLKDYDRGPVITSVADSRYPCLQAFPLAEVLGHLGHDYFNNTAAYAVAYAIHIGVDRISLFGCDYTYPDAHDAEQGRACVEFWLGFARAHGINITIPQNSSLMDALHSPQERLYGYDGMDVHRTPDGKGGVEIHMTPRATLPTADEVEARYDHAAHPNKLVSQETPGQQQ